MGWGGLGVNDQVWEGSGHRDLVNGLGRALPDCRPRYRKL